jgi:ATP-dependent Clp protease ATP-binding subunit ClpB
MTSNIGAIHLSNSSEDELSDSIRERIMNDVRARLRPEFLNRLDDVVLFSKLTILDMEKIVAIQVKYLEQLLNNKGINIEMELPVKKWLATAGYDPRYGARPLKRVIQKHIQNSLALSVLDGSISEGSKVSVILEGNTLSIVPSN